MDDNTNAIQVREPRLCLLRIRFDIGNTSYTYFATMFNTAAMTLSPVLRVLSSVFGVNDTPFTYGEFAEAMTAIGFIDDREAGMLLHYDITFLERPLAYNPAGLEMTTVVTREVQDAWADYMYMYYGWNMARMATGRGATRGRATRH
ncbi:hypothetical protein L227DRAFT_617925 [Lentinus tigrinus ALCF2SS1-6]|uniref:Uncharacterized protein n=1 Tax=Lentinus tigrinus ALCF2SS1-6 TaxID=1328759 RepID=A0A5C2RPE0_9APHY|nr:hypothetical protein L227DRAFT_617925 [Lentinus tigrinus ALCF2SS1-6]